MMAFSIFIHIEHVTVRVRPKLALVFDVFYSKRVTVRMRPKLARVFDVFHISM